MNINVGALELAITALGADTAIAEIHRVDAAATASGAKTHAITLDATGATAAAAEVTAAADTASAALGRTSSGAVASYKAVATAMKAEVAGVATAAQESGTKAETVLRATLARATNAASLMQRLGAGMQGPAQSVAPSLGPLLARAAGGDAGSFAARLAAGGEARAPALITQEWVNAQSAASRFGAVARSELGLLSGAAATVAGGIRTGLGNAFTAFGSTARTVLTSVAGQMGIAMGVAGLVAGGVSLVGGAVTASNNLATSLRILASTSRLTSVPLAFLQRTSDELTKSLGTTATATNTMVALAVRFTSAAGRTNETGQFLTRWLDLAASRGLSAAEAMSKLQTTLEGQDEGLNALGLANPSDIYKRWATAVGGTAGALSDAQQKQTIVLEVMQKGGLVAGAYAERLATAQGATDRLTVAKQNFLVALGQAITGGTGYTGVLATLTRTMGDLTAGVTKGGGAIRSFVSDLASIASAGASTLSFIAALGRELNVLNAAMQVASAWAHVGIVAGAGESQAGLQRAIAQYRAAVADRANPNAAADRATREDANRANDPFAQNVEAREMSGLNAPLIHVPTAKEIAAEKRAAAARVAAAHRAMAEAIREQAPALQAEEAGSKARIPGMSVTPDATMIARAQMSGAAKVLSDEMKKHPIKLTFDFSIKPNELTNARKRLSESFANIGNDLRDVLVNSVGSAFRALGEGQGVGQALKVFGASLLSGFGEILVNLGKQTIEAAGMILLIKHAFKTLNPYVMAAAGIALVALGSFLGGMGDRAMGHGGTGGGGGGGGSFSAPAISDTTTRTVLGPRAAPVNGQMAPTGRTGTPTSVTPVNQTFNVMGNTPEVQRFISEVTVRAARRGMPVGAT